MEGVEVEVLEAGGGVVFAGGGEGLAGEERVWVEGGFGCENVLCVVSGL